MAAISWLALGNGEGGPKLPLAPKDVPPGTTRPSRCQHPAGGPVASCLSAAAPSPALAARPCSSCGPSLTGSTGDRRMRSPAVCWSREDNVLEGSWVPGTQRDFKQQATTPWLAA
ncbi:unnamed protein product [Urochloa humidicola]